KHTVLIWGDSFAAHYVPGLVSSTQQSYNILQYTAGRCPPVLNATIPGAPNCQDFNQHIADILQRFHIQTVVIAARWERYWGTHVNKAMLEHTIRYLKSNKIAVVLVGQGPSFPFNDPVQFSNKTRSGHAVSKSDPRINSELQGIAGYDSFFDPNAYLCHGVDCMLTNHGKFLYYDSGHYSTYGSNLVSGNLLQVISSGAVRH
ncbi:MAG: hypothetical protein L0Y32_02390, partial [Nevskiales bacterium]|nr:hypothetical protein [Nevskiales bacterium]